MDVADVNNDLFVGPAGFKRLTNNQLLPNTEKSYFTDIGLTIDSQHNAKFFFGLDYKRLVRDNSKYGGLYSEYNEDDLLGAVKIRKLILKRRRVANDRYMLNTLGSPVDMADLFDKDEVPEVLIAVTTEGEPVNGNSSSVPLLKSISSHNLSIMRVPIRQCVTLPTGITSMELRWWWKITRISL